MIENELILKKELPGRRELARYAKALTAKMKGA